MKRRSSLAFSPGAAGPQLAASGLDWRDLALCAQTDPEIFFPEKGGSVRAAKRVCRSCDVRAECLENALVNGEEHGIWGGMSEPERRILRRDRGLAVYCGAGLHEMTPGNTYPSGACRACNYTPDSRERHLERAA